MIYITAQVAAQPGIVGHRAAYAGRKGIRGERLAHRFAPPVERAHLAGFCGTHVTHLVLDGERADLRDCGTCETRWAAQQRREGGADVNGPTEPVLVHREDAALPELDVRAVVTSNNRVVLTQGEDRIAVPLETFGRFVDNLERVYTGQEPVVATTEGSTL